MSKPATMAWTDLGLIAYEQKYSSCHPLTATRDKMTRHSCLIESLACSERHCSHLNLILEPLPSVNSFDLEAPHEPCVPKLLFQNHPCEIKVDE